MRKGPPLVRIALLLVLLQGSLTLVVWRQSHALELQRSLEVVRAERAAEEAHRSAVARRMEHLESRSRVSDLARERLGMRVPAGHELVILPLSLPGEPTYAAARAVAGQDVEGG